MSDKVRVGLVGAGGWAQGFHAPVVASHSGAVLAAVCARTRERAEPLAAKHGVDQVYTDYQDMIDSGGVDAVIVATPEDVHHQVVMAALAARLHVLCEKPMAFSADESSEMLDAANQAGVKHMVQFTNRGLPHYRHIKTLLDDGYIGQPYHGYFYWPTGWAPEEEVNAYNWALDAGRAKGAVNELGAHIFDLARWYFGDVVRVSASLKTFVPRLGLDGEPMETANDSAFVLLDFANGAHAVVHIGSPNIVGPGLRHTGQTVILSGTDGTLETRGDPWTDRRRCRRSSASVAAPTPPRHWRSPSPTSAAQIPTMRFLCSVRSRKARDSSSTQSLKTVRSSPVSTMAIRCSASSTPRWNHTQPDPPRASRTG